MRTPAFADENVGIVTVEFSDTERWGFDSLSSILRALREWFLEKSDRDTADRIVPEHALSQIQRASQPEPEPAPALPATYADSLETPMNDVTDTLAAEKLALAQREAALAQKEAEMTAATLRQRRASDAAFADALIQQGRLLPRDQPGVVELLSAVADSAPVEFAEEGQVVQQTPRQWLETFLKRLPVQVDFNERSAAEDLHAAAVAFAAPPGYQVDTAQLAMHQKAQALSRSRNIPYLQALTEVA